MSAHPSSISPFRQPRAVWAVAFACVISFMGIGLVDPILPSLAGQLHASPAQVELLFTSYLVVTAVAMLVTGWVSSRIGAKRTLITGLALIVVFAALAGPSGSIGGIVGFRAGWGLGNALFIATSLAVIVSLGQRRVRRRDHPLRDRAGRRHRGRPAARRRARQHQLARTVLRGLGADGDRAGRDRGAAAGDAAPAHRSDRGPL